MNSPLLKGSPAPVFVANCSSSGVDLSGVSAQRYWNQRVATDNPMHADKVIRVRSFFIDAEKNTTTKLAEGVFLYGHCIVCLFVKLRYLPVLVSPTDRHFNVIASVYSFVRRNSVKL
jgi:hypothetical protein